MSLTESILPAVKPGTLQDSLAKACKLVLVVWLLGVFVPLNLFWANHNKCGADRKWTILFPEVDFPQYYIAAVAARYGLWAHLYPQFKPEAANRPGRRISVSVDAEASPEILEKIPSLRTWQHVENIGPPPEALICLPLAYFTYAVAYKIWMTGLVLATLGTIFCAVKIYRRLGGDSGCVEGALYLLGMFLPLLPRVGGGDNVLMFLALFTAIVTLSWVDNRPFALAAGLIVPAVFKGLTVSWCPLLLVKPVKWRALAWMAVCTLLLNGAVLLLGGLQPYATWLHDILPAMQSSEVEYWRPHSMNLRGIAYLWGWERFPAGCMQGVYLAGLLAVYLGFWKRRNDRGAERLANICAALVAALVLFNLCHFVSWLPYIAFLIPFVGWAVMECRHCSSPARKRLKLLAGFLFVFVPVSHLLFLRFLLPDARTTHLTGRDLYLGVELLFLALAYRRLFCASMPAGQNARQPAPSSAR